MNKTLHATHYEAIDPLALVLPANVYTKLIEGRYPHVPLISVIDKAMATLTKEDKQTVLDRAKNMIQNMEIVEKAVEHSMK